MEIDIVEGAKILIRKHYKRLNHYKSFIMLAFEDNCFCFQVIAFYQKSEVYSKCLNKERPLFDKKHITGKQMQLSSKANVFSFSSFFFFFFF